MSHKISVKTPTTQTQRGHVLSLCPILLFPPLQHFNACCVICSPFTSLRSSKAMFMYFYDVLCPIWPCVYRISAWKSTLWQPCNELWSLGDARGDQV